MYKPCTIVQELRDVPRPSRERKIKLTQALSIAKAARRVFDSAHPSFPDDHFHWQVAPANLICKNLSKIKQLTDDQLTQVARMLHTEKTTEISFSRFCFYIGRAVEQRGLWSPKDMSMLDIYGSTELLEVEKK